MINNELKEKFSINDLLVIVQLQAKYFNTLFEQLFGEFYNKPIQVDEEDIIKYILKNIDSYYISTTQNEIEIILELEFILWMKWD